MTGLKIILMLLAAFFTFKTVVKGTEIVKARELVNRSFLLYILGIAFIWWLFQTFDFENRFFWQGLISGGIFCMMSLVPHFAEKIGDQSNVTRSEIALILATVCISAGLGVLLGVGIAFVILVPCLSAVVLFLYFGIKDKIRAKKYDRTLHSEYAKLQRTGHCKRLKEEIADMTDSELLERAIIKSKQRLLLSGKNCDCGNCRNVEGRCRFQGSVKLQSNDYIKGCELELFHLEALMKQKQALKAAKKKAV
ncbi:MAG: hypothetical protein IJ479_00825 [Alphaproteobacteria bacterium]|nr:hypothetical protein [Alphaproteobacteria bacterium]